MHQVKFLISIKAIEVDGKAPEHEEQMGTYREINFPVAKESIAIEAAYRQLHEGMQWLRNQITNDAVRRLVYGKKEDESNEISNTSVVPK